VLLLSFAASGFAQEVPFQTETAVTAKARTLVLEAGFEAIADEPSYITGLARNRWEGPLLRLVYSPADNVELDLEWIARVGVWNEEGREVQGSDWGDVTLRAKWRIHDWGPGRPTIGARFGVTLPQTEYEDEEFRPLGLGPNTLRAFAQALFTQPLGPVRLDANAGMLLFDEVLRQHEQRDFVMFGVALEWAARPAFRVAGEVAGRLGDGHPGAEQRAEARLGVRVGGGRWRAAGAVRRGLCEADGSWGATVGLTFVARSGG
jgi:hypothetical protein